MRSHAQAVVIGGGLIGCSVAYHLTKLGWRDVVLLERNELTSGSTWHAAANIHGLHDTDNISRLQYYTMRLYAELERETGQSCGIMRCGSLYLAQTEDREHQLRMQAAKAKTFGVGFDELSVAEAQALHPLVDFTGIRCVMLEPDGGNVDPSGVTHAYAIGAKANGAEIHRHTPVIETNPREDGGWDVVTPSGTIHADVVVNAAGLWAREVGRMAGIDLPLMTMEHQYFVTEAIPEIAARTERLPSVADRDGEYYLRQEGQGLLIGAYEKDARFWAEDGTPPDFGHELLPDDLERIEPNMMAACERLPAVATAGIKRVINGPMIWSPDAGALLGPVPELRNYYCCNGIIPGFSQSGGLGTLLAQWIVEGEPELDVFGWDLARYGLWTTKSFTKARALDCYAHRFKIHFPYEERDAGRPVRTRPVYDLQRDQGARFGLVNGWEHPIWYARNGAMEETAGFTRQPWFDAVAEECRTVREDVGILDTSTFAKIRVSGTGAADWLNRLIANKVPSQPGRTCLTPLIGRRGGIAGDITVTRLDDTTFMLFGGGQAERPYRRLFDQVPRGDDVKIESLTDACAGVNVAGPKSRELLSRLTNDDLSNEGFPFLRSRTISVAGIETLALRVSFTGELGWELYVPEDQQVALHTALREAGADLGAAPVGARALLSLRIEKGYGSWGREYSIEYWPQEVGLDRFVKLDKGEFLNGDAVAAIADEAPRYKLAVVEIDADTADASGGEPVFLPDGVPTGRVTSGSYGHTVGKSLALVALKAEHAVPETELSVTVLGRPHAARVLAKPPHDPDGTRLRM